MFFQGQGQIKDFPPDKIAELETMRNPNFPAGQVFDGLGQAEIEAQARQLVTKLDVDSIEAIVAEAGLDSQMASLVRDSLVGRRQFLADRFGPPAVEADQPKRRLRLERIMAQPEEGSEKPKIRGPYRLRNCESILSDGNHIENQTISFIDARDRDCLEVHFKLTADHFETIANQLQLAASQESEIRYHDANSLDQDVSFCACQALELDYRGLKVRIAKPFDLDSALRDEPTTPRSALGLVQIEVPCPTDSPPALEEVEARVNDALVNLLGIPEGLAEPDSAAEANYKLQRYSWHHRTSTDSLGKSQAEVLTRLKRQEVFPGHSTIVDQDRHRDYERRYGEFAAFHKLYEPGLLPQIIDHGGLMSSHERYRRGLLIDGLSTMKDFNDGGADNVFTRTIVDGSQPYWDLDGQIYTDEYYLIIGPEVYDRTDWYAYSDDHFGATHEHSFAQRQSPDNLFQDQLNEGFRGRNEQMFRTGIASQTFRGLACKDRPDDRRVLVEALMQQLHPDPKDRDSLWAAGPDTVRASLESGYGIDDVEALWRTGPEAIRQLLASHNITVVGSASSSLSVDEWLEDNPRMRLIDQFQAAGVTEMIGQPIERFIVEVGDRYDFIDIANNRTPRSQTDPDQAYRQPEPRSDKTDSFRSAAELYEQLYESYQVIEEKYQGLDQKYQRLRKKYDSLNISDEMASHRFLKENIDWLDQHYRQLDQQHRDRGQPADADQQELEQSYQKLDQEYRQRREVYPLAELDQEISLGQQLETAERELQAEYQELDRIHQEVSQAFPSPYQLNDSHEIISGKYQEFDRAYQEFDQAYRQFEKQYQEFEPDQAKSQEYQQLAWLEQRLEWVDRDFDGPDPSNNIM